MPRRRTTTALAVLALSAVAGGCGADHEGPTDEQQIRAVVARFAIASRGKDYQTICDDVLSSDLVRKIESVGLPCESALQRGLSGVRDPRLEIRQVSVIGSRALVAVHSTATGEPPSDDAIQLVRINGQWRIASLAAPEASTTTPSSGRTPTGTTPTSATGTPTATTTAPRTTSSTSTTRTSTTRTATPPTATTG
ncbi:nuclear transport factor 2 family protein [Baekduia soli]|uniref:Nuclear transport factor 2 family protein n=1 Tax=Baekduia soli TaxID=496014 RepID=A0A5B8U5C3_9ACTN|nr:nuclear transport factor 2 family protein [Baekduia soli]QEC48141.1 nuclear transport factor 2 family protein [Baekduia soli]